MEIANAFTKFLGIRDIGIHVIAVVKSVGRISTFIINFIFASGSFLINGFLLSCKTFSNALRSAVATFEEMCHDISVLYLDLYDRMISALFVIAAPFLYIYNTTIYCYQTVHNFSVQTTELISSWSVGAAQFISYWSIYIVNLYCRVVSFLITIPEFTKQWLVMIGNSIWLWATMIPVNIVYICSMSIYSLGHFCEEIALIFWQLLDGTRTLINRAILFWADMPLESLLGLIIGSTTVIVLVKYGYPCFKRVITFVGEVWNALFHSLPAEVGSAADERGKSEETLCVVCQDRPRRVVSFPCRHLCVCRECSDQLALRAKPCPVCRVPISRTLTVYT